MGNYTIQAFNEHSTGSAVLEETLTDSEYRLLSKILSNINKQKSNSGIRIDIKGNTTEINTDKSINRVKAALKEWQLKEVKEYNGETGL